MGNRVTQSGRAGWHWPALLAVAALAVGPGCDWERAVEVRPPALSVASVSLDSLGFEGIDLRVDLAVDNPNLMPATVDSLSYELRLDGRPVLRGREHRRTAIAAAGRSLLPLQLHLSFDDLRAAQAALGDQDTVAYALQCSLWLDLPLLADRRLVVRREGRVPAIRLPELADVDVRVRRLSLSGADLDLRLKLHNPNAFAMELQALQLEMAVGGRTWAQAESATPLRLAARGSGELVLPVSVDLGRVGLSAYGSLAAGKPLAYEVSGFADVTTEHPLLPRARVPLFLTGALGAPGR